MRWWPISESNQGHTDFQSVALPTELIGHMLWMKLYLCIAESLLLFNYYLIFKLINAKILDKIAIIQNLTIILFSAQFFISKW